MLTVGAGPTDERDVQWMVPALFMWLADERVRRVAVTRGRATPHGIATLGGLLHMSMKTSKPVEPTLLRRSALELVGDRVVRRMIVRVCLEQDRANRERYPLDDHGPVATARRTIAELQDLRKELETEAESGIVRPW